MKKLLIILSLVWVAVSAKAQIENPVHWTISSEEINDREAFLVLKADIDSGWHVYSQFIKEGGPMRWERRSLFRALIAILIWRFLSIVLDSRKFNRLDFI